MCIKSINRNMFIEMTCLDSCISRIKIVFLWCTRFPVLVTFSGWGKPRKRARRKSIGDSDGAEGCIAALCWMIPLVPYNSKVDGP